MELGSSKQELKKEDRRLTGLPSAESDPLFLVSKNPET